MPIRPYQPSDKAAVYRIAYDTALFGAPIKGVIDDLEFVGSALLDWYIEYEPEHFLVAEEDGKVLGYLTGCSNSKRYNVLYRENILPRLKRRLFTRGLLLQPNFLRLLFARWRQNKPSVAYIESAYPAHLHLNLAKAARHRGLGVELLYDFLAKMKSKRLPGVHLSTATEGGKNFFAREGFAKILSYPAARLPKSTPRDVWVMTRAL